VHLNPEFGVLLGAKISVRKGVIICTKMSIGTTHKGKFPVVCISVITSFCKELLT
jgi:hypothetical protein